MGNFKKLHIVNLDHFGWILEKIADELSKIKGVTRSREPDPDKANYYINWHIARGQAKRKNDIFFFTDQGQGDLNILRNNNLKICMSNEAESYLKREKIRNVEKCPYFGTATTWFKRLKIGIAGRPYGDERKGEKTLAKLVKWADKNIFVFRFNHPDWDLYIPKQSNIEFIQDKPALFFQEIDYYLQASSLEGGGMDIINAIATGTPIIAKPTGFFADYMQPEDRAFGDFEQLKLIFFHLQASKQTKRMIARQQTWKNFREWHEEVLSAY